MTPTGHPHLELSGNSPTKGWARFTKHMHRSTSLEAFSKKSEITAIEKCEPSVNQFLVCALFYKDIIII